MESFWSPSNLYSNNTPSPYQVRFEARRVRMVLKALGLSDRVYDLMDAYEKWWGERRLTFESFHDAFPTFPVMLEAQSFFATSPQNPLARMATLMTRFEKTFLFERYQALLARYRAFCRPGGLPLHKPVPPESWGLPLGMVFPWDGIKGGLILHNGEPRTEGSRFVYEYLDDAGEAVRLTIERYPFWLLALARSGWTPEAPPESEQSPRIRSQRQGGAVLRPWLVRACGRDPAAAYLLSWLLRTAGPRANPAERPYSRLVDGACYIAASCRQLAEETGLNEQQARRALDHLKEKGFVSVSALPTLKGRKNHIQVERQALRKVRGWTTPG